MKQVCAGIVDVVATVHVNQPCKDVQRQARQRLCTVADDQPEAARESLSEQLPAQCHIGVTADVDAGYARGWMRGKEQRSGQPRVESNLEDVLTTEFLR